MDRVFTPKIFHLHTKCILCAIKMLFKTTHKNIWLERFFMSYRAFHNFKLTYFYFFLVCVCVYSCLSGFTKCCESKNLCTSECRLQQSVQSFALFFCRLIKKNSVEFVYKQIKVKDHFKRRQYCICVSIQYPVNCTQNMPH